MSVPDPSTLALLRLTLTPGLGAVRIRELIHLCGSAEAAVNAPASQLAAAGRLGKTKGADARSFLDRSEPAALRELEEAARLNVQLVTIGDPRYPPLLRQIHDPPPLLYVKGELRPIPDPSRPDEHDDRYPVAIVGSRTCTHYGSEQAHRFGAALAQCGLTVVSGGARGVDTAAHRGAVQAKGRTVVVQGCGLAHVYPPDNADLFDAIVEDGRGAIVSELPLHTSPVADNFPARNRIISGMSLGVLVVEAGRRSGAIITAHEAVEQGREVFALPSRVDSKAAEGTLGLLKEGAAQLVTHPDDILQALENPARHHHLGTHEAITADPSLFSVRQEEAEAGRNGDHDGAAEHGGANATPRDAGLSDAQRAILAALDEPRTLDQLGVQTGLDPGALRAQLTVLEIRKRIRRAGSRIALA